MLKIVGMVLAFVVGMVASTDQGVAVVKTLQSDVKVQNSAKIRELSIGDSLFTGDVIMTGAESNVGVIFNDGTLLTLGPSALASVDSYLFQPAEKKFDFKLGIQKGMGVYESGKMGKLAPEKISIRTPEGIIGVRGTKFLVEVKE